jgi:hypothetical protein
VLTLFNDVHFGRIPCGACLQWGIDKRHGVLFFVIRFYLISFVGRACQLAGTAIET